MSEKSGSPIMEKPETPDKPERPDKSEMPDKSERPDKSEMPERPDKSEKPETPDKPERPDKSDKSETPDKSEMPERPERPEKLSGADVDLSHEDYVSVNGHRIYISGELREYLLDEDNQGAIQQFVAMQKLPGLIMALGLPDIHAGYLFPVGSIAVVDADAPDASISPEGIGYDINCGVRCLRTNLRVEDLDGKREQLADILDRMIPSGMGGEKERQTDPVLLDGMLSRGMRFMVEKGEIPEEDLVYTESSGSVEGDSRLVSQAAKHRGLTQLGTLGSGNHYLEVQVVERVFDKHKGDALGIEEGAVVISIHTGSRGLGHSICSGVLKEFKNTIESAKKREKAKEMAEMRAKYASQDVSNSVDGLDLGKMTDAAIPRDKAVEGAAVDKNKAVEMDGAMVSLPFRSALGQKYLTLMNSAANFAWVNRSMITQKVRRAFSGMFPGSKLELITDSSHNIGKVEQCRHNGKDVRVIVHRKGASRILPPGHPELPARYKELGQPVLIGGSMGTASYIIVGAPGCADSFYSTAHGSGRIVPRKAAMKKFTYTSVAENLRSQGIVFRTRSEAGLVEESGDCYKDVDKVVGHSDKVGLSYRVARLKPIIVVKG